MEELLNKLKKINCIRAIGDYADYEPNGKHKDTIYFAEDEEKIYLNGKSYGGSDVSSILEDYAKVSDLNDYATKDDIENVEAVVIDGEVGDCIIEHWWHIFTLEKFNILFNKVKEAQNKNKLIIVKGFNNADIFLQVKTFLLNAVYDIPNYKGINISDSERSYFFINNNGNITVNEINNLTTQSIVQSVGGRDKTVMSQKACTDSFVQKEDGKVLSSNDYTNTDKAKVDNTYTKTEVDTIVNNSRQNLYDALDNEIVSSFNYLDNKKVDKVEGKQLSTEDFTTALKQKLEGLTNFDDSELDAKIAQLQTALNVILNSENTTAVIDTWQEIEAFLAGITNTETLTGLLNDLKSEIVTLCANTYLSKSGGIISNVNGGALEIRRNMPAGYISSIKYSNNDKELGHIGVYDNTADDVIYPIYQLGNNIYKLLHSGLGTSSQFLKADGSVDSTAYLPTASYTASDVLDKVKSVDGPGSGLDADTLDGVHNGELTAWNLKSGSSDTIAIKPEAHCVNYKAAIDNSVAGLFPNINHANSILSLNRYSGENSINYISQLGFSGNGNLYYRAFNGSAPDSTTPWKQLALTSSNVASADKLTTKQLTNEDLNTIKNGSYSMYVGIYGNTCTNKPTGVTGFNLMILPMTQNNSSFVQVLTDWNSLNIFRRYFDSNNNTWGAWQQLATTDGAVAKLTTKHLTNEDLNDIKDVNFSVYHGLYNNTCANKPFNDSFSLIVNSIGTGCFIQIIFDKQDNCYRRQFNNSTWSVWKKMLTEDDIADYIKSKVLTRNEYKNLTTKNDNTLYFIKE